MKTSVCASIAVSAALMVAHVSAHGQMMEPKFRPITARYRKDCLWGLKGAGDDELQWAPLENLSGRGQADQPPGPTFDIMNGCRGLIYEEGNPVTALQAGVEFTIKYFIQAPHPGTLQMNIVKPKTDANGKVTHEKVATIKTLDNFATAGGNFDTTATIPTSVTGCDKAGDCALQFYWHSPVANQTYPTCADITIGGSSSAGASTTDGSDSGSASTPATKKPTTKKPAAATPSVTSKSTTSAPAATATAPAPAATKKKCTAKTRRSRK
uniref:Chitin-binding type-4 domain-containing protein n=1 Tax=Globisporangium ultimum (strain ATCC 200006 / CBS 805.95 / DAOM BR144) TaxID=431595 RepID=K3W981_GLOUD